MMYAERRASCKAAMQRFTQDYEAKYPKAVKAPFADVPRLLIYFDFPATHWKHLRTTNPIESMCATVKLCTRVTKGAGSQAAGLTMACKLLEAAQQAWRRLDEHDLLPLVRAGAVFKDGPSVERTGGRAKKNTGRVAA